MGQISEEVGDSRAEVHVRTKGDGQSPRIHRLYLASQNWNVPCLHASVDLHGHSLRALPMADAMPTT